MSADDAAALPLSSFSSLLLSWSNDHIRSPNSREGRERETQTVKLLGMDSACGSYNLVQIMIAMDQNYAALNRYRIVIQRCRKLCILANDVLNLTH